MKLKTRTRRKKRYPAIRVGDKVQVIAGKDKGEIGEVLKIDWENERILVKNVNIITRHIKPKSRNDSGERKEMEAPIHYSNILLYSPVAKRGVRVRMERPSPKVKRRVCVKTTNIIE